MWDPGGVPFKIENFTRVRYMCLEYDVRGTTLRLKPTLDTEIEGCMRKAASGNRSKVNEQNTEREMLKLRLSLDIYPHSVPRYSLISCE